MRWFLMVALASLYISAAYSAPTEKEVEPKLEKKAEEKVEDVKSEDKLEKREGKSLKQGNVFLSSNEHKTAHGPSYLPEPYQPAYGALTSDPLETAIGYVYYYLPTAENYLPKYETVKKFSPLVKRAMPIMKRMMTDASETMSSWSSRFFGSLAAFTGSAGAMVAAFGRKKRDLSNEIDISPVDSMLHGHDGMIKLAREVDKYLMMYLRAFSEPDCMEKFLCEGGDFTGRMGGAIVKPLLKVLEPFLPEYMRPYADAFKRGFRDRSACSRSDCSVDTFFK